jgi:excisionase family DNA binding protein
VAQTATQAVPELGRTFTVPGAAEYLECSQMHIYRLIKDGELQAVDISRPGAKRAKTRIRECDMAAYLESKTGSGTRKTR